MSLSQKLIAAMFQIPNEEQYGFYVAPEYVLVEKLIELTEMPFNSDSVDAVKSRLPGVMPALKKIGVEVTRNGDCMTVWAPGVLKHV